MSSMDSSEFVEAATELRRKYGHVLSMMEREDLWRALVELDETAFESFSRLFSLVAGSAGSVELTARDPLDARLCRSALHPDGEVGKRLVRNLLSADERARSSDEKDSGITRRRLTILAKCLSEVGLELPDLPSVVSSGNTPWEEFLESAMAFQQEFRMLMRAVRQSRLDGAIAALSETDFEKFLLQLSRLFEFTKAQKRNFPSSGPRDLARHFREFATDGSFAGALAEALRNARENLRAQLESELERGEPERIGKEISMRRLTIDRLRRLAETASKNGVPGCDPGSTGLDERLEKDLDTVPGKPNKP